jgi:hypothetical protein
VIAITPEKRAKFIQEHMKEAYKLYSSADATFLVLAVAEVKAVLEIAKDYAEALDIKSKIDERLKGHKIKVNRWLFENKLKVKPLLYNVYPVIEKLSKSPNFDSIVQLDGSHRTLLANLLEVSSGNMAFDSFVEQCNEYSNPASSQDPAIAGKR